MNVHQNSKLVDTRGERKRKNRSPESRQLATKSKQKRRNCLHQNRTKNTEIGPADPARAWGLTVHKNTEIVHIELMPRARGADFIRAVLCKADSDSKKIAKCPIAGHS